LTLWLPSIEELSTHNGDWALYEGVLRAALDRDFVASTPTLDGKPCYLTEPVDDRFWHMISEGTGTEASRTPDLRRCERLCWVRPIIEAVARGDAKLWRAKRGKHNRAHVALPDYSHLIVLSETKKVMLLITSYCVDEPHRRRKLHRDWNADPNRQP
jgi:hypothetical protein